MSAAWRPRVTGDRKVRAAAITSAESLGFPPIAAAWLVRHYASTHRDDPDFEQFEEWATRKHPAKPEWAQR